MADPVTDLATRLPCTFGIVFDLPSSDVETNLFKPGDRISITSSLTRDSYVYVLQLEKVLTGDLVTRDGVATRATEDATTVWVMFPADIAADPERASDKARVPAGNEWMSPPASGMIRTLMASRPQYAADLVKFLQGREPLPGTVTVKNAKTKGGWP
jgi:hypothetical protein